MRSDREGRAERHPPAAHPCRQPPPSPDPNPPQSRTSLSNVDIMSERFVAPSSNIPHTHTP
eukprot:1791273-Rhodomonas_salina.1